MALSGLGYAGTSTAGFPNTKTTQHRPSIAGTEFGPFRPKDVGIKIVKRRARRKSSIKNPKI